MEEPIIPLDMQRIFLGDYTALYFLEVAFRIGVIYGWTLLLIRWIGGRGVAQLSMIELLLVIALGSAVGDALFYDDVPLLIAMWVILLVVGLNKLLDKLIVRSDVAARVIDGRPVALVKEGVLVCAGLDTRDMGPNEAKAMLRQHGVANLGQVQHAYLEINGALSVFRFDRPRPGLPLVPPADVMPPEALSHHDEAPGGLACCAACGLTGPAAERLAGRDCPNCGRDTWTEAVAPPDPDVLPAAG